jgi:cell division protein FtsZ
MSERAKRIRVLGIGGAGCNTVEQIASRAPEGMEFAVMDCDAQTLETCTHIERRIEIGKAVTEGLSSGGDLEVGRRCAEHASDQIETLAGTADLLLIVVGLGGGLGSGAAPVVARIARNNNTHTLFFTVLPFEFEGALVRNRAHSSLRRLRTYADAIVQMPNKRIQPDGDALLEDSQERATVVLSSGVVGLWRLLTYSGICNIDYASLYTMLHYCDGTCRFSCAAVSGEDRADRLIDALYAHPLAGDGEIFKEAPGLIVGVIGGDDLRLSDVEKIAEKLIPAENENCWVRLGIARDPSFTGRISAMVLAAEAWKIPLVDDGHGGLTPADPKDQQGELPGVLAPQSRLFGGTERTIWKGEDLDVPTYLRRKVKLPR